MLALGLSLAWHLLPPCPVLEGDASSMGIVGGGGRERKREGSGLTCSILVVEIKASKVELSFSKVMASSDYRVLKPLSVLCVCMCVCVWWGDWGVILTDLDPHGLKAQTYPNFDLRVLEW